ncbi:PREDICTED: cation-independent mannose-6-phosphate receptor [Nanorana parkeri]|uniref:cation-independent mannose-6-phosphate receptor n=1 Tax=Nanorana parkeri TaxID=125878 RepID=UPI000854A2AC|nr:PREDICTED: cation-independent mannose-6-phosphate receptor [Nanorana parkeri]
MKSRGTVVLALLLIIGSGQSTGEAPKELCGHTWEAIDDDREVHYIINICENLKASDCGGLASFVCAHDIRKNTSQPVGIVLVQSDNNVLVYNTSVRCPGSDHTAQSIINLVCGKSLGTPEFVKFDECVNYFEWRTFTACKKNKFKPIEEVPCYVFDVDYKKHDLNPLIRTSGGYLVNDWDPDSELYINVCRTIGISEGDTSVCPAASSACLVKDGKAYDIGRPKEPLKSVVKERLVLHYETDTKPPDFCNNHQPAVTITFICPTAGTEVTSPRLTANTNCRYEIEWVTENACHTEYLESDDCKLVSKERGISIDLTPLKGKSASPYHVEDEKGEYVYYLNVCDKASGGDCSGEMSSCQYKKSGGQSKGAGSYKNQTLRYSDGDITLTYPGGEKCSSDFQRMTVINFECNETAVNDGKGVPEFDGEADCTYFFSWETKYACPKKKEDLCHVESKKKHFNLLDLIRSPESSTAQNWEALKTNPSDKNRFYINVCHEVLQRGGASGCEDDAAICAVDSGGRKNLGKFLSSPKLVGDHIVLEYTEGSECAGNKRIQTNITLICSPGNLESPPILKQSDSCLYEFEWNTAAACVLSKTEGDNCRVSDSHAGFYFDLSPLTKKSESYVVATDQYDFYINVCSNVTQESCDTSSGACQMTKTKTEKWNIGVGSSKLSYYDGMIQLSYTGGTPYNDVNKTPRSSLITFLCDRDADIGQPEYQKEDNNTYNFKWYTKYACPALSVECIVVDEQTNEQYDLSSLSMVHGVHTTNWFSMDESHERRKKYYINVCRSLIPITGCDPFTSVCQMQYTKDVTAESVEISNLGVASKKPVLESSGKLILEYSNGSACTNMEGVKTTYSSVLHLVCKKGATDKSPIFVTDIDCVATFLWYTEAACPVKETQGKDCKVENPNTGFVYNLESLRNDSGYVAKGNGKTYKLNICGPVNECGLIEDVKAAGCEFENNVPSRPVQISQLLDLSSDFISLTYHGAFHEEAGQGDMFTINFVCNDDLYPGELVFKREEINSETHLYHTFFDFKTAMACSPSPVDCQVTDTAGNEYDLSDLSQDAKPWIAVDTSDSAKNRTFYLSVCKPLPVIQGCPGGVVGSCMKTTDNKSFNLGFIQMSPQVSADGTLTIVYMSGDKCRDNKHYSTRIIFQCDHNMGSPVFQELDDCEYVFLWRTSEACPVIRAEGDNCQVTDPKYGHIYDLKPLGAKNVEVKADEYLYQFRVCGEVTGSSCTPKAPSGTTVSSCQVKGSTAQLAGLTNQKLIYENGLIMINYIGGDLCHQKHNRTTLILFYCDKTEEQPVFMKETTDCIYMFQWRTPLACPPFKPIDCSFKDTVGNSYDLSALSHYTENWEAEVLSGSNRKYHLNICKPLVPESGLASCPYGAAACLIDGTKAISLGKPSSSPRWDDGVAVLQYTNGDRCPDGLRNRTATIRFMCDLNQVFSKPQLITALDDCEYNFLWITPAACKLKINTHDDCKVTNPATGYLFDLSSLLSKDGYVIRDRERSIKLNICTGVKPELCDSGAGVCVSEGGKHWNAGKAHSRLTYSDQVLRLVYDGGDQCIKNPSVRHQSVFTFVCGSDPATGSLPSFVSFSEDTCTWQFSWHTSLVCEKEMKCSVQNGTSNINLGPLIKHVGSYEVLQSNHEADSAVFYINLCQPLNEVVGAKCPPGAAACRVGSNGDPIDIGHPTSPQIDPATQTVSIKMDSSAQCDTDKQLNYSTIIIFRCNKGIDPGSPKFVQEADCNYVFEWGTPLVCSDEEIISGCSLMDQQLHYTFNLSSLSVKTYSTSGLNPYYIGVCSAAGKIPSGKCDGAVCLQSGNTAYSYGNRMAMKMEYRHLEEMLVLQYAEGDPCPPVTESGDVCILPFTYKGKAYSTCISEDKDRLWCPTSSDFEKNGKWAYCSKATDKRSSTIFFKCDEDVANGAPALVTDTKSCSATFEWKTQLACIPRKLDCKFIINRKTYDLRMHSSLTGSWSFASDGSTYYLNLCQRVNQGPSACSASASVCQERNGKVQVLGQVHTQNVTVKGDIVSVTYSGGDACGNDKRYSTTIELTCANVTGKPTIKKYNSESCQYIITWETRAACAVIPNEVVMTQGIIRGDNGARVNLSNIYTKSYNASGDVRVKDQYMYEIQLSGRENSAYQTCKGASVCQVKKNGQFTRAVGASNKAKYYIDDDSLEAVFTSNSKCGKDPQKNATSTIFFHCSQTEGEGRPEFLHETADCQYLFSWYTASVCSLMPESSGSTTDKPDGEHQNQYQGLSGRSQAVGAILSILLVILVACLVVLLLYKKERRETVMYKLTNCCRRSSSVSYKYTKINTEEEMDNETEWLMEEVSGGHSQPHHENGHVRSVKAGAFTSLHVDDLDSEDEVLTVPEVRIQSARNQKKSEKQPIATYPSGSDENLIGVFNGGQEKTRKSRSGQQNKEDKLNVASFHDDSDEDMLNI